MLSCRTRASFARCIHDRYGRRARSRRYAGRWSGERHLGPVHIRGPRYVQTRQLKEGLSAAFAALFNRRDPQVVRFPVPISSPISALSRSRSCILASFLPLHQSSITTVESSDSEASNMVSHDSKAFRQRRGSPPSLGHTAAEPELITAHFAPFAESLVGS